MTESPIITRMEQIAIDRYAELAYQNVFGPKEGEPTAARFVATFHRVETIEPHPGLHKARIHYHAGTDDNEPEYLDTDPLNQTWAAHIHTKAQACTEGDRVLIVKRNAPDPTGQTPAGFRRIVWLHNITETGF